jgi:hypothetical protein
MCIFTSLVYTLLFVIIAVLTFSRHARAAPFMSICVRCAGRSALPARPAAADRIWLAGIALSSSVLYVYNQAPPVGGHGRRGE